MRARSLQRIGLLSWGVLSWPALLLAQSPSPPGFDTNTLHAPLTASDFHAMETGPVRQLGELTVSARLSYLARPSELRLPSSSPTASTSRVVEGVIANELVLNFGLGEGFEIAGALHLNAPQWGQGFSSLTGDSQLSPVAFGDPRLALSWARRFDAWTPRIYAILSLPAGGATSQAGEAHARGELGVSLSWSSCRWRLAADVALRLREPLSWGWTRLGHQLRFGLGGLYELLPQFFLGPELVFLPNLETEPTPPGGEAGLLLQAEAGATARFHMHPWSFGAHLGTGLPLSRSTSIEAPADWQRAWGSPLLRASLDARIHF